MSNLWQIIALDFPPLATALFACIACSLVGNFLIVRRQSLMGDALAHAVLPGIVIAFLLAESRGGIFIFIGATLAAISSAICIEAIRSSGKIENSAAMGVVFSVYFAAGVLLIEQAAVRNIDLDPDCLIHGQLETLFWIPPTDVDRMLSLSTLSLLPTELFVSFFALCFVASCLLIFFKELKISSFDPALATALGFHASLLNLVVMIVVACTIVASFKAMGSILVIAMLVCPAATARMCTNSLTPQILLSTVITAVTVVSGYILAAFGPLALGYSNALNAGGMIAFFSGLILAAAALSRANSHQTTS